MGSDRAAGRPGAGAGDVAGDAGAAAGVFDERMASWIGYRQEPWARVRYDVVAETLRRECERWGPGPMRVLDAGGGDGGDALPLARRGHDVTLLDHAPAMLGAAREAAAAQGTSLRTVAAGLDELPGAVEGRFDLVLCHHVLQYRTDPGADLARLAATVAPGGLLSVVAANPASDPLVIAVRRLDPAAALAVLDAPTVSSVTFEHDVRRLAADDVVALLAGFDLAVHARYGLRCVTDLVPDDALKHDPAFYADLLALELALCDRAPYVGTARAWQLVARREA